MKTRISNNIYVEDPSDELIDWCKNNLIVPNPTYTTLKRLGKDDTIRRRHVPEKLDLVSWRKNIIIPFGCLRSIWEMIFKSDYDISFNNNKDISIKNDEPTLALFDYQEIAVQKMINAKGGVLVANCGAGKTYMGTEIIRRIGKKALWLCHTGDLLRQAKEDILGQYPNAKIGLTTDGKVEIGDDITISTVQTMEKLDPIIYKNEFDIVICDECAHVAGAPTQMKMFQKVISQIPARYKYGLTATPARSDGMIKSMYAYIGTNINGMFEPTYRVPKEEVKTIPSIHEKIEIDSGYDDLKLAMICDTSGMIDYNALISSLCDDDSRTNKILENVKKCHSEGRKQVILSGRVEHCQRIVELLNNEGIKAELCVGKISAKKRKSILSQETPWDVIVATYSLLKEGVSVKELDTLHLATPIRSKNDSGGMIIQCAGRIERYLENKKQPIVYDYVDMDIPYCVKAYIDRRRALKNKIVK